MSRGLRLALTSILALGTILPANTSYAARPVLVINTPTNPPLTEDDQTGLLDVVVSEALKRNGYELKLIKLPAERGLVNANNGIEDGDLSRISGLEKIYPNLIRVPEKLFDMDFVAFSRNINIKTDSWDTLAPYYVGIIRGWKILENNITQSAGLTSVKTAEQLIEMLNKNRVDIVVYSRWMGMALVNNTGMKGIKVLEPPLASREMFMYLHEKHQGLVQSLAESIREIKREGLYEKVFNQKLKSLGSN